MKIAIWGRGRLSQATQDVCSKRSIPCFTVGRDGICGHSFDAVIDFSSPDALPYILAYCRGQNTPLIIGTTGHNSTQIKLIREASKSIAIVYDCNFSLGILALKNAVKEIKKILQNWDCVICETHRKGKADAPSGTAKALNSYLDCPVFSLRIGENAGEHSVIFETDGEQLTLSHKATKPRIFAEGAVLCAQKAVELPCGLYTLGDVLACK